MVRDISKRMGGVSEPPRRAAPRPAAPPQPPRAGQLRRWARSHPWLLSIVALVLVLAGAVALAALGLADRHLLSGAWRLWPLALVGLAVGRFFRGTDQGSAGMALMGGTLGVIVAALAISLADPIGDCARPPGPSAPFFEEEGEVATGASFRVTFDCGTIEVAAVDGGAWRLEAREPRRSEPRIRVGDEVSLAATVVRGGLLRAFAEPEPREWLVSVPARAGIQLRLTTSYSRARLALGGARLGSLSGLARVSDVEIDLRGARIDRLAFDFDTSRATLLLPSGQDLAVSISANGGRLALCLPAGVGLEMRTQGAAAAAALDRSGLARVGSRWRTAGFRSAAWRITIDYGGLGSQLQILDTAACAAGG